MKPKVLLTTTCRWLSGARLAAAFVRAGCTVEAVCPADHPLGLIGAAPRIHAYNVLRPVQSLRAAILAAGPDVVWPCDEQAMLHLHRLYEIELRSNRANSAALRELIEQSIGKPESFPILESRDHFLAIARDEGIATPATAVVTSQKDIERWLTSHSLPAVIKADGTSAGEGVIIAHGAEEALAAYRQLERPLNTMVVAKRAIFDRDRNSVPSWLLRRKHVVSIQQFIQGRDANIAVACWQGEVLSSISMEVIRRWKAHGPATVVRVLPDGEMLKATKRLVKRLELSGLVGLDFMIEERTGKYFLIEINGRATQTAHLPLGRGRDLPASLAAKLGDSPLSEAAAITENEEIALFPLARRSAKANEWLAHAYHDVPWDEPELVRVGLAKESRFTQENWDRLRSKLPFGKRQNESFPGTADAEEPHV